VTTKRYQLILMENTTQLGAFSSRHSPAKGFLYFSYFIFILFSGISGLIYFKGILAVKEGRMNFSGDINILYWVIAFIMVLGLIILFSVYKMTQGKTHHLYENGIITEDDGQSKTLFFRDMEDIYLFSSGKSFTTNNLAFRNRSGGDWEILTVRYSKVFKAINYITDRHAHLYVDKILAELGNNKSVTFNYINYGTSLRKRIFATGTNSFLKVEPKDIVVYKDRLIIDSKTIMISNLERFSVNNWINQINLYNKQNEVVFSTATNGIFSGKSFITLMDKLINQTRS